MWITVWKKCITRLKKPIFMEFSAWKTILFLFGIYIGLYILYNLLVFVEEFMAIFFAETA